MSCQGKHTYNEEEPEPRQCWECGRPQNLADRIQKWINDYDNDPKWDRDIASYYEYEARDLLEWILMDMDPAEVEQQEVSDK